ncbi:fire exit [Musca autumnalis]|uniref:fire exit n=1 Tax=Musca autumnalis TaxID=221902 RepID=UPI003CE72712
MLLPQQTQPGCLERLVNILKSPIRPKHIRLSAVLICINQFFIAIILLFIVILAYIHIEEANSRAIADMEDQRDNAYYSLSDLILNRLRFHLASDVTMTSRVLASILVCCSSVYLLSAIGLLIGIYKSREEFVLLWLVLQSFFFVAGCVFTFWVAGSDFVEHTIGKPCFFLMAAAVLLSDASMWYIIYNYYHSIRLMNKLREIATVAIPCPPPGSVPFHFRRENMYLGSNGYKHILSDAPDGNY